MSQNIESKNHIEHRCRKAKACAERAEDQDLIVGAFLGNATIVAALIVLF